MIDGRVRRSCGSADVQTAQSQPIVGTPIDVPLPSTVSVAFIRTGRRRQDRLAGDA